MKYMEHYAKGGCDAPAGRSTTNWKRKENTTMNGMFRTLTVAATVLICGLLPTGYAWALTLDEFLRQVRESHPLFVAEELAVAAVEAERDTLRPTYTWSLEGGPRYTTLGEVNSFDTGAERTHNATVAAQAVRPLPTGGTVSTGIVSGVLLLRETATPGGINDLERYTQGVEASIVQPLLRNRGDELRRLGFDLAAFDAETRRAESEEIQEEFLAGAALLYVEWVGTLEQLEVAQLRVRLAQDQLAQVRALFRSNLVDRVDLLRAQTALQGAEQLVAQVEAGEASLRRQLEVISESSFENVEPSFALADLAAAEISLDTGTTPGGMPSRTAVLTVRAAQPLSMLIEQLKARRNANTLRTKPELNLELSAGLFGGGDEFGDSFLLDSPDLSVGLIGRIPLGYPDVQADDRLIGAQIAQLTAQINRIEREVATAAEGLLAQLQRLAGVIELSEAQLATARERTTEEQELYRQARVPLSTVIQSQDEEQQIRLSVLQGRARYHSLAIQYRSLTDRLLQ